MLAGAWPSVLHETMASYINTDEYESAPTIGQGSQAPKGVKV